MGVGKWGTEHSGAIKETFLPNAAVGAWRFVDKVGNLITTAGARAAGITSVFDSLSTADIAKQRPLSVVTLGAGCIELNGTVNLGDALMSTNDGRAVKWVPGAGNFKSAIAREGGNAGDRIRAFVLPIDLETSGLNPGFGAVLSVGGNAVAPTNKAHHVGAGLIKNITVPAGGLEDGTVLWFYPDAAFTTDTTGNVTHASTAVIGVAMAFVYDAGAGKFSPSY